MVGGALLGEKIISGYLSLISLLFSEVHRHKMCSLIMDFRLQNTQFPKSGKACGMI